MQFFSLRSPEREAAYRALGKSASKTEAEPVHASAVSRPAGLDPKQIICLIDANKFYCACERVFQPSLRNKALVVLTNNDGCVAALTPEAKALGIKRGMPAFQFRDLVESGQVEWRSSNYELYGSISKNIADILTNMAVRIERYSIDENFLDITGMSGNPTERARLMRKCVMDWQRIPTCVGVANTKTLAKLANHLAKDWPVFGGVLNWLELAPARQRKAMSITPVSEVWGIGARTVEALDKMGVKTVLDFWSLNPSFIRARWGVVLERTWRELHGIPCIPFEENAKPKEQIIRSRAFGKPVTDIESVISAVSKHMSDACISLRRQKSVACEVGVFFHTNYFKDDVPQYSASPVIQLPSGSADTLLLTRTAINLVRRYYRKGFAYQKAGITLSGIKPVAEAAMPQSLFDFGPDPKEIRRRALMETLDGLTRIYGRGVVTTGSAALATGWEARHEQLSQRWLTSGSEILRVR